MIFLLLVLSSVKNGSPCVFIEVKIRSDLIHIFNLFIWEVILKGSGKCADLFAFALSKLTIRDESSKTESLRK